MTCIFFSFQTLKLKVFKRLQHQHDTFFSYDLPERFYEKLITLDGDWTQSGWLSDSVLQDLKKTAYIEYLIEKFGDRVEDQVKIVIWFILYGDSQFAFLAAYFETFLSDGLPLKIFKKKFYMAIGILICIRQHKSLHQLTRLLKLSKMFYRCVGIIIIHLFKVFLGPQLYLRENVSIWIHLWNRNRSSRTQPTGKPRK